MLTINDDDENTALLLSPTITATNERNHVSIDVEDYERPSAASLPLHHNDKDEDNRLRHHQTESATDVDICTVESGRRDNIFFVDIVMFCTWKFLDITDRTLMNSTCKTWFKHTFMAKQIQQFMITIGREYYKDRRRERPISVCEPASQMLVVAAKKHLAELDKSRANHWNSNLSSLLTNDALISNVIIHPSLDENYHNPLPRIVLKSLVLAANNLEVGLKESLDDWAQMLEMHCPENERPDVFKVFLQHLAEVCVRNAATRSSSVLQESFGDKGFHEVLKAATVSMRKLRQQIRERGRMDPSEAFELLGRSLYVDPCIGFRVWYVRGLRS